MNERQVKMAARGETVAAPRGWAVAETSGPTLAWDRGSIDVLPGAHFISIATVDGNASTSVVVVTPDEAIKLAQALLEAAGVKGQPQAQGFTAYSVKACGMAHAPDPV